MVPYRGRFALRVGRLAVSLACAAWYLRLTGFETGAVAGLLAAHAIFSAVSLIDLGYETPLRNNIALAVDAAYYLLWLWVNPDVLPVALASSILLAMAALLYDKLRAFLAAAAAVLAALAFSPTGPALWPVLAVAGVAVATAFYRAYVEGRMSNTLRHNVIIRSQAQNAREAERQRIAADFHDGPLQNFIGFQMRLEIIRRQMERDPEAARAELVSLQELCKSQVTDLRSFVRSMRPPDEGMSLAASLARMADSLQRDTGITAVFQGEELHDPPEIEISLEILQIVREAFNNLQKHSGATRVELSAYRRGRAVEIVVADNGSGFPFAGTFTLEELDATRLGPISIRRRVKALAGDMTLDSRPGAGSTLTFRVPF